MRRFAPPAPLRATFARLSSAIAVACVIAFATLHAQIPGRNVNMVSGQQWPGGDPFLQRQNEPSIAASTRNPLHLLAGSNDYRTIDLPGLPNQDENETGDAWLGLYKSVDGGQRWTSGLIPGYPQDQSPEGLASPLKGYQAGADPVVRAGISGLLFYSGLVFDREENGKSAIFVSRFIDENNQEAGDPFAYLGTTLVARSDGSGGRFLDKPWMAVDLPRPGAKATCEIPLPPEVKKNGKPAKTKTQKLAAGNIYVAYTSITGDGPTLRSEIYLHVSEDCGRTFGQPRLISDPNDRVNQGAMIAIDPSDGDVFVTWRRFGLTADQSDGIMVYRLPRSGKGSGPSWARKFKGKAWDRDRDVFEHRDRRLPAEAAQLDQFDQNTTVSRFRSNAYPTATVDGTGRLYVAWSERGFAELRPGTSDGDARVVIVTSRDGAQFTAPHIIDEQGQPGHQLMPTITFAGGRLMLVYYDVRETRAQLYGPFVSDAGLSIRQTMDIRAAMGTPGDPPAFEPSVRVSDYLMGFRSKTSALEQLQVNPPNLPMFKQGTVPFIGDYIDVTAAPMFVVDANGKWTYNTATSATPPVFHAVWTDNRDVRPPANGDWTQYTPPTSPAVGPTSLADPTQTPPICVPGNAGSRNQNVYSSRITGGLVVGSPGNAKPLSPTLQRAFVVFAHNTTAQTRSFRMRIAAQPEGGRASFSQFPLPPFTASSPAPLVTIDMRIPPRSLAARTVYATSTDPDAQIPVDVFEIAAPGAAEPLPDGLASRTVINPDVENPDVENPDVENPDVENPDVENAEVYNPDVENPDVENPDVENPDVENPDVENPDVENVVVANPDIDNVTVGNPDVENPDVENPDVENPDVENPDVENGAIADITWSVRNTGNTTAAFNVNLFLSQATVPQGLHTQLVIYKTYKTPVTTANGCELRFETRNILVTNIPQPNFITANGGILPDPNDSSDKNPTLWLAPNEVGKITLRIVDNDTTNNVLIRNAQGELVSIDPFFNPEENDVTPGVSSQAVNSDDAEAGVTDPPVNVPTGSNLLFLEHPTSTAVNTTMAPPVRVRVIDNSGAPVPGVPVTLSLNVPLVTLLGGSAVTDAVGVATFGGIQIDTPGTYRLAATANTVGIIASAQSNPFAITVREVEVDLAVTQSATPAVINTDSTITLTVTNNGPGTASGVIATASLPQDVVFIGVTDQSCVYDGDSRVVTCAVGTMNAGTSRQLGIVVRPTATVRLTTIATVTSSQPDVVSANNTSEYVTFVSAYAPCSSPAFSGPFISPLDTTSTGTMASADFNEDGFADLFFAEGDGNFVLVLSDGRGGYQAPQYFAENNPAGAISADFNADGHADIAVINSNPGTQQPAELGVAFGDGTGNVSPGVQDDIFLPLAGVFTIDTGDFNHDAHADLVVSSGNSADNTVAVLLGVGDGTFGAPTPVPAGAQPGNIVLGDFNRDGDLDIAVNNIGLPTVSILRGNGEGGFAAPQAVTLPANSQRLRRMNDVNGDGAPDLAATTSPGGGVPQNLVLLLNDGAGNFPTATEIIGPRGVGHTDTADLNGDGRLDIAAIVFPENRIVILEGDGTGQFTETASYLTNSSQNHFLFVDLNADGRPDIAGTVRGGYYLLLNACAANPGESADLESTVIGPETAAVGDQLTYTAFVANNGPDQATDVVATVVIPSGMNFVSSTIGCTTLFGTVQCSLPPIDPGGNQSFAVTVQAFAAGTRTVQLMASAAKPDPDSANNVGAASTSVAAGAFTFVVTNTNDAGPGSLRQAITDSNLNVGSTNNIQFAIQGRAAPYVIAPQSSLPNITVPVIIDGTTQPGYSGVPLIELTGINLNNVNGLNVNAGGSTIRGLSITRWVPNGINLAGTGNSVVEGNYIGLTPAGVVAGNGNGVNVVSPGNRIGGQDASARNVISGNNSAGVNISGQQANGALTNTGTGTNVIGNYIGTTPDGSAAAANVPGATGVRAAVPNVTISRNVISGNGGIGVLASVVTQGTSTVVLASASNLVVQSNFIGTDATGTVAVANNAGVQLGAGSGRIGGVNPGEGNVISGNASFGINLTIQYTIANGPVLVSASSNYVVEGNFVGVNAAGSAALANGSGGIFVSTANNTIGGTTAGAGNVISGNGASGISLSSNTNVTPPFTATNTTIQGNRIGTDATGTVAIGNGTFGIVITGNASDNLIGGGAPEARNVISGNGRVGQYATGIHMNTAANNTVLGNFIGTDATSTAALPNANGGIEIDNAVNTIIGGPNPGEGNVISGNGSATGQLNNPGEGISLFGATSGTVIRGNMIGTDITGTTAVPNAGDGILVSSSGADNVIGDSRLSLIAGAGNTIAFNAGDGIGVNFGTGTVTIRANSIFNNGGIGIDLGGFGVTANDNLDADSGPNGVQNYPVIADSQASGNITGTLHSTPDSLFLLDVYAGSSCDASGFGEGRRHLGSMQFLTDASGNGTFLFALPAVTPGEFITATATDIFGATSEFSRCVTTEPVGGFVVTNTNDAGPGSLRQAILDANSGSGFSNITFNIPNGPATIAPVSPLPVIFAPVSIDGYTQPGSSPNTLAAGTNAVINVELRGPGTGGFFVGLNVARGAATIKGLAIGGFTAGIQITEDSTGSRIEGNFIGTNAQGTVAVPNGDGVQLRSPNNSVGAATLAARNLISGNTNNGVRVGDLMFNEVVSRAGGSVVVNNLIGTTRDGLAAMPNREGVAISVPSVTIGGGSALERNVVSGNIDAGINSFGNRFDASRGSVPHQLIVRGNYVGVGADGTTAVPNRIGVNVNGQSVIDSNVISGNGQNGMHAGIHFENTGTGPAPLGTVYSSAAGTQVIGNLIGLNASGTVAVPNGSFAPQFFSAGLSASAPNLIIGGTTAAARNVISGNHTGINLHPSVLEQTGAVLASAEGALIIGNYIGLGADGTSAIGNREGGINLGVRNVTIGGLVAGERNVISGNGGDGINVFSSMYDPDGPGPLALVPTVPPSIPTGLVIANNYIGTDRTGLLARGNGRSGATVNAPGALIKNNVISANTSNALNLGAHFDFNTGQVYTSASNAIVENNMIGVDATGNAPLGNGGDGIRIGAPGVRVGGHFTLRNVIAANGVTGISIFGHVTATQLVVSGSGTVVRGNYIGLNAAGTSLLANVAGGLHSSVSNVTIGGGLDEDNVFGSAHYSGSIRLFRQFAPNGSVVDPGGSSTIRNNIIGLNANQTQRLNSGVGIEIDSPNNIIRNNVIAGGGDGGGFSQPGIAILENGASNVVAGNIIGTNPSGAPGLGNLGSGIDIRNASGNTIGGVQVADRNVVVANGQHGVNITARPGGTAANNVVRNNFFGANFDGASALSNGAYGVSLAADAGGTVSGNVIGGGAGEGNLISGNGLSGVSLQGAGTIGNQVIGNRIGTIDDGTGALPNQTNGVFITNAVGNTIENNLIAFNLHNGIIAGAGSTANSFLGNAIRANTMLGIDLNGDGITANDSGDGDAGANGLQNFPVLSNASNAHGATTRVDVDLTSFANGSYTLQFFASSSCDPAGYGEGERLIATYTGHAAPATSQLFMNEAVAAGHRITALATDSQGNTSEFARCVEVDPAVASTQVVNTNDSGPGSLRDAIVASNLTPGLQVITFNIPGVSPASPASITLASPLPQLVDSVAIDGSSQPGYDGLPVIEIHPNGPQPWVGFDLRASNITIKGLSLGNFADAILGFQGFGSHLIHQNIIGTTRASVAGFGNTRGIQWRAGNSDIRNNVISGNQEGLVMLVGASANTLQSNLIGIGHDGVTAVKNAGNGITMSDGVQQTTVTGNTIAHNDGWGVDLQFSGTQVSNTTFHLNVIGLDANGNDAGNLLGGIRVDRAPGTQIGAPGFRNIISGNGGNAPQQIGVGVHVLGDVEPRPKIQSNFIGLDATGLLARSNNNKGVVLEGPAIVGGGGLERNYISGNGDPAGGAGIIVLDGAAGSQITGNVIGLNVNGESVGNGYSGITVAAPGPIQIGGAAGFGNIISGNGSYGISVLRITPGGPLPSETIIEGNTIGTDASLSLPRGNGSAGINIEGTLHRIGGFDGTGNVIASNGAAGGIRVIGSTSQVEITLNTIRDNGGLGIDLAGDGVTVNDSGDADAGPNGFQNYAPVSAVTNGSLTSVTIDTNALAPGLYAVQFFSAAVCDASGHGEGDRPQLWIAGVTGGSGLQTYNLQELVPTGHFITATITNAANQTSEFSPCRPVTPSIALTPNPLAMVTNASAPLTVTLNQPAGAGGVSVTLSSDNAVAAIQPSIVIAEGTTSANATVTTGTSPGTATVSASATGFQAGAATVNVSLRAIALSAPSTLIGVGRSLTGTIALAQPAPSGGLVVDLVSGNTNFVTVSPASVTIAQGATTGSFTINGVAPGSSTITATATGASAGTLTITATTSSLISLGAPPVVAPGQSSGLAVSLGIDAPPGGVTISFVSSDTNVATITPSVFIPAGLRIPAANPQITGVTPGTSTITANASGFAPDAKAVSVTLTLTFTPATNFAVIAGRTSNITLNLSSPAPAAGLTLSTTIDNTAFATVPSTVFVGGGLTSVAVPVTGVAVGTTTIRANGSGIATASASVRVDPTPLISVANATIGKDLQAQMNGSLGLAAPPGGVVVTITSMDPAKVLVATADNVAGSASITRTVAAGSTTMPAFWVQALDGTGTANIETSATGYATDTSTITLQPSGFVLNASDFTTNTRAANTTLRVDAARLLPGTLAYQTSQAVRGGLTVNVSITSSNTAVGTIVGSPVTFRGGDATLFTAAFDPAGVGSSTIGVTQPAGFSTPGNLQSLLATVEQPAITVGNLTIGKDLQASAGGSLGAVAPAGNLLVTITSLDSTRLLLANTATSPGSPGITVQVNAGSASIPAFWVHALDSSGAAQFQVSAPGYASDTVDVTFQPSGFVLNMSPFSTNTFAANTTLRVDPARLNPATLNYVTSQAVRGGLAVSVPITSSNTTVGTIVGSPVAFASGDSSNFDAAFDPAASGTTTVSVVQPAGFSTPANLQSVTATVTAPDISIGDFTIGRDLQVATTISLGATPPNPVTVTVTSNNGAIATITRDGTVAGGNSVTFTNVSTANVGTIVIQGRALGSTTLTVQAPGYNDGTSDITVDPSGFILNMSNVSTTTFAANTNLRVDAGRLNPSTLNYVTSQPLRGGLTVNVPITSSDTNVGSIVGSPVTFNPGDSAIFTAAFDPATSGDTTVRVTQPAGFSTPNNLQSITATVTAPDITIGDFTIGRDLQIATTIGLGATPPSPVTVTVTSNNATIATVTRDGTIAGGNSVTFTNVTTTTVGTIFIQGRGLGSTTLTVQASGYNDGTSAITVDPSGFVLNMSNVTTNTFAANTTLRVDAARLNPATLNYVTSQPLRGGLTVNVPISSSNTGVGTIVGSPVAFAPGDSAVFTASFDPAAQGSTTISIAAPGGFHTPSNLQSVTATVNAPNVFIGSARVGRDLQSALTISLESAPPSPVTVTVTSNNGSIATITRDGTIAGGTSVTFTNVSTTTVGNIVVQGRGLGDTTITVTAPGYVNGVGEVTVDPSGFVLNMSPFTTSAAATNTTLRVDAARLDPVSLNYSQSQALRGGLAVNVPVSSSNTTVGTIVGSPAVFNPGDSTNFATAFNPAAAGTTTISVTAPAGFTTPSNLQAVTATVTP